MLLWLLAACTTGGGEGGQKTKAQAARWYDSQERQQTPQERETKRWTGWFRRDSIGWRTLTGHGPVAWFQWVFLSLDDHDPACRWRRLCQSFS